MGLLGGIGSGKSRVAAEFAKHGGRIVAGDPAGHEALRHPDIKNEVVSRWGSELLDEHGEVIRKKLGAIVFADQAERKALEGMVYPFIGKKLNEEIEACRHDPEVEFVVLDAAVMLEAGWNNVCDWLVYVDVPREVRLRRLAQQRGWTEKEVAAREAAQMPLDEKKSRADAVVENGGSLAQTAQQVEELLRQWNLKLST